jgi:hypothetical protein
MASSCGSAFSLSSGAIFSSIDKIGVNPGLLLLESPVSDAEPILD